MLEFVPHRMSLGEHEELFTKLINAVSVEAEEKLGEKLLKLRKEKVKVERKIEERNIFRVKACIVPRSVKLVSREGVPMDLCIATNPAVALASQDEAVLFLRVATIGSVFERTFIVKAFKKAEELKECVEVKAETMVPTVLPYESIEDPRVSPDNVREFYYVKVIPGRYSFMIYAELDEKFDITIAKPVAFESREGTFLLRDCRDTFALSDKIMVLRPLVRKIGTGGIFFAPRKENVVSFDEVFGYPELMPRNGEEKTGGNSTVKISKNEYLLFYHIVDKHGLYYTYAALLDAEGELIALSEYPVLSPSLGQYYGRRPGTIFVCGSMLYKNEIILSAGRDDEVTILYAVDKDTLLSDLKYLKG